MSMNGHLLALTPAQLLSIRQDPQLLQLAAGSSFASESAKQRMIESVA